MNVLKAKKYDPAASRIEKIMAAKIHHLFGLAFMPSPIKAKKQIRMPI
jgi:hypothetical protein